MFTIDEFRIQYGLSIGEVAKYLGISKSTAAKAEKMERTLPHLPDLRFSDFKVAAINQQSVPAELRQRQQAKIYADLIDDMQYKVNVMPKKIKILEKQLIKAQKEYPAKARLLDFTDHLEQISQGQQEWNVKAQVWTENIREWVKKKLEKCDEAAQLALRVRIELLKAEKDILKNMIKEKTELLLALTPSANLIAKLPAENILIEPLLNNANVFPKPVKKKK